MFPGIFPKKRKFPEPLFISKFEMPDVSQTNIIKSQTQAKRQQEEVLNPRIESVINKTKNVANRTLDILNPGSTYLSPYLQKKGVNPLLAGGIGLIADIATPGPSEIKQSPKVFKGFKDLSTKLLTKLEGKSLTSKQEIMDLTNMPSLKQSEREIVRKIVDEFNDKVPVTEFASKVKSELLPLKAQNTIIKKVATREGVKFPGQKIAKWELINLPEDLRGPVADYYERIYQSPIKTQAGDVHFSSFGENVNKYFAHTRVEDLPKDKRAVSDYHAGRSQDMRAGDTRRVIEIQSDLFQKGNLELESKAGGRTYEEILQIKNQILPEIRDRIKKGAKWDDLEDNLKEYDLDDSALREKLQSNNPKQALNDFLLDLNYWEQEALKVSPNRMAEISKLEPYRNTWHERVIREEVKQAAKDGKTKLQFPTGETAMKIEGLGGDGSKGMMFAFDGMPIEPSDLAVGKSIYSEAADEDWIITDVLGDGKFKAVPKDAYESYTKQGVKLDEPWNRANRTEMQKGIEESFARAKETFDISGKVHQSNPIYKFYEKEVGKYLSNKYNAKRITDPQSVEWWELDVPKQAKNMPVEAFGLGALPFLPSEDKKKEPRFKRIPKEPLFINQNEL